MHRAFSPRGRTPGLCEGCGAAAVGLWRAAALGSCGCGELRLWGAEAVDSCSCGELRLWGPAAVSRANPVFKISYGKPREAERMAKGLAGGGPPGLGLLWWQFCQDLLPGRRARAGWAGEGAQGRGAARPTKQQLPIICERVGNRAPCHARARAAVGA